MKNGKPVELYRRTDEQGQAVVFVGRGVFGNGRDGLLRHDGKQRGATDTVITTSEHLIGFAFDAPATATALEGISGPGDSGGPAHITHDSQLHVAGVSSHQDGNGRREGTYGVLECYTRVRRGNPRSTLCRRRPSHMAVVYSRAHTTGALTVRCKGNPRHLRRLERSF